MERPAYPWIRNDSGSLDLDDLLNEFDGTDANARGGSIHPFQNVGFDRSHALPGICFRTDCLLREDAIRSRYTKGLNKSDIATRKGSLRNCRWSFENDSDGQNYAQRVFADIAYVHCPEE